MAVVRIICIKGSEAKKEEFMDEINYKDKMFTADELNKIRDKFYYVDCDIKKRHRLFFDNAGGSLRLKAAEEAFKRVSEIPDASEHSNELALELLAEEDKTRSDIKEIIFGAKGGVIYPSYTASQIIMDTVRIFSEHAHGTNYVTTVLEHPSSFDAMTYYAEKNGCELRVAKITSSTSGIDAEDVIALIDENTAILSCMVASNISGFIFDIETICKRAREINPDIHIICDAVQHAPHGVLSPEQIGADMMHFAPYKFFGVRGFAVAWMSDRVSVYDHNRLLGKSRNDWEIGSPATAQFAAVQQIIEYVVGLGQERYPNESNRRRLYEEGMKRIAEHERGLMHILLEGTNEIEGLRYMDKVKVGMDGSALSARDLILGIEFSNMTCEEAVREYDRRGVVAYERSLSSMYSRRMLEAFKLNGVVRISPLHVNSVEDIEEFLLITKKMTEIQH